MDLVVISHKICWPSDESPSGYATDGGFPFQMAALSNLFDSTTLVLPCDSRRSSSGGAPLEGHNLQVAPLSVPRGAGWVRKLALVPWLIRHSLSLSRHVWRADAVHTPIPGDIGTFGLWIALCLGKPLFVRYCGTWGRTDTLAQRFWLWQLERIAGGRNVVMATGGSSTPPSSRNPAITWIFATTLTDSQLRSLPSAPAWRPGQPLRLVTVSRLEPAKNIQAIIRALPLIRSRFPAATLDVVGSGSDESRLRALAFELGIDQAVTFHGWLSHRQVLDVLVMSHLFVFPTQSDEGFPKAVHEALACGLPVVTTPVSVLAQLIGDRHGCLLLDVKPGTIAQAVFGLCADPDRLAAIARSARQMALAYSLEHWGDEIGARLRAAWNTELRTDDRLAVGG